MVDEAEIEVAPFYPLIDIQLQIADEDGNTLPNLDYILTCEGEERRGVTDTEGWIRETGVPSHNIRIKCEDGRYIIFNEEENEEESAIEENTEQIPDREEEPEFSPAKYSPDYSDNEEEQDGTSTDTE